MACMLLFHFHQLLYQRITCAAYPVHSYLGGMYAVKGGSFLMYFVMWLTVLSV